MSDTQNQWIPVSERLPENGRFVVVFLDPAYIDATGPRVQWAVAGYRKNHGHPIWMRDCNVELAFECVTHWMDLPEPPEPPKPADPFEAWWESTDHCGTVRAAWNAAKEYYAKRYMTDYEDALLAVESMAHKEVVRAIWNAAQGNPEV